MRAKGIPFVVLDEAYNFVFSRSSDKFVVVGEQLRRGLGDENV